MTIIAAYSPDEFGEAAITAALEIAKAQASAVLVVNASRGDALVDEHFLGSSALSDLKARLAEQEVPATVRQSVGGDVAEQVLQATEEVGGVLIVVGLRHRTPVGKMLMGSVAQRILLDATVPVLAVKPGQSVPL